MSVPTNRLPQHHGMPAVDSVSVHPSATHINNVTDWQDNPLPLQPSVHKQLDAVPGQQMHARPSESQATASLVASDPSRTVPGRQLVRQHPVTVPQHDIQNGSRAAGEVPSVPDLQRQLAEPSLVVSGDRVEARADWSLPLDPDRHPASTRTAVVHGQLKQDTINVQPVMHVPTPSPSQPLHSYPQSQNLPVQKPGYYDPALPDHTPLVASHDMIKADGVTKQYHVKGLQEGTINALCFCVRFSGQPNCVQELNIDGCMFIQLLDMLTERA